MNTVNTVNTLHIIQWNLRTTYRRFILYTNLSYFLVINVNLKQPNLGLWNYINKYTRIRKENRIVVHSVNIRQRKQIISINISLYTLKIVHSDVTLVTDISLLLIIY